MPRRFERANPVVMHDTRPPRDHFAQQIVLAAEVIVDQRKIDTGDLGDGAQRHAVEAGFAEAALGGIEDREPRRIAAPAGRSLNAASRARRRLSFAAPRRGAAFRASAFLLFMPSASP